MTGMVSHINIDIKDSRGNNKEKDSMIGIRNHNSDHEIRKSADYLTLCACSSKEDLYSSRTSQLSQKDECMQRKQWWGHGGDIAGWFSEKNHNMKRNTSSNSSFEETDQQIVAALREKPLQPGIVSSALNLQASARSELLAALRKHGDVTDPKFLSALNILSSIYLGFGNDSRKVYAENNDVSDDVIKLDGTWITLSKPTFPNCLGTSNVTGDFMYSLGRMSFDMFRPANLKCSIQRIINEIKLVEDGDELPTSIPRSLQKELHYCNDDTNDSNHGQTVPNKTLRVYNIIIHFTIEPRGKIDREERSPAPSNPIKAVMTNNGYMLPDPSNPNRFTVWFTGGELAPYNVIKNNSDNNGQKVKTSCSLSLHHCRFYSDNNTKCAVHGGLGAAGTVPFPLEWEEIFGQEDNWKRSIGEQTKMFAVKMLLGAEIPERMDDDGTMSYELHRPIAGHVDVLYIDEDLRITKGNHGSIMVQTRSKDGFNLHEEYHGGEEQFTPEDDRVQPISTRQTLPTVPDEDEDEFFAIGMDLDDDLDEDSLGENPAAAG